MATARTDLGEALSVARSATMTVANTVAGTVRGVGRAVIAAKAVETGTAIATEAKSVGAFRAQAMSI